MTMICDACGRTGIEWHNLTGLSPYTRCPHCGSTNRRRPEPRLEPEDESDEITAGQLIAEVERLTAESNSWRRLSETLERDKRASNEELRAAVTGEHQLKRNCDRLTAQRDRLLAALNGIEHRVPIMGSVGEYRAGQADALAACWQVVRSAIAAIEEETHGHV